LDVGRLAARSRHQYLTGILSPPPAGETENGPVVVGVKAALQAAEVADAEKGWRLSGEKELSTSNAQLSTFNEVAASRSGGRREAPLSAKAPYLSPAGIPTATSRFHPSVISVTSAV
jgi:hypothetical protein